MWESIRSVFEILYFLSGIIVAVIAFIGLKQLKIGLQQLQISFKQVEIGMNQVKVGIEQISLLKHDIEIRNKRLSVDKAIEFIQRFNSIIFPLETKVDEKINKNGYQHYSEKIPDVWHFPFKNNDDLNKAIEKVINTDADELFNELEIFSAAFISRLADEEIAFPPLGRTFVRLVEKYYDSFCVCRLHAPYINTIKLYDHWKNKINKIEIDSKINKLEKAKAKIKELKITPLGVDEKLKSSTIG
jgi:hypothetical protein